MLTVYLVDGTTRVILPSSAWAMSVRDSLSAQGHTVQATDQDPETCVRDESELSRRDALLESTGL